MVENLAARNALEVMQRWLGIAERQRDGYSFIGDRGFDIGELPITGKLRAYAAPRDSDSIDQLMVHCTAVTDGFGVQRWGPTGTSIWRKRLLSGEFARMAPYLYEQMDRAGMLRNVDEAVRFIALCSRFRNDPYHIVGTHNGYLLRNRPIEQVSWHGNGDRYHGGNAGIGIAFDASPSSKLTDSHIATFRATVRLGHLAWMEGQKVSSERLRVVAHAQSKWPGRANDPGGGKAQMWRRVVIPEVNALREEGNDIVIDESWHWGTGHPLPDWGRVA